MKYVIAILILKQLIIITTFQELFILTFGVGIKCSGVPYFDGKSPKRSPIKFYAS